MLRSCVAMEVVVLLAACGVLPPHVDRPFSKALQPSADSPLVRMHVTPESYPVQAIVAGSTDREEERRSFDRLWFFVFRIQGTSWAWNRMGDKQYRA
jgi:hypothetical protein